MWLPEPDQRPWPRKSKSATPVISRHTRRLGTARPGTWIRVPGLVLMRQRPGTAKGIVFITVEDEFGVANLLVYADIGARDRAAMIGDHA